MGRCNNVGCDNETYLYWCDTCRVEMTEADKWYLIGFLNLWMGKTGRGHHRFNEFFEMGIVDRKGQDDGLH